MNETPVKTVIELEKERKFFIFSSFLIKPLILLCSKIPRFLY